MNNIEFTELLVSMEALLRRTQAYFYANTVETVLGHFQNDPERAMSILVGNEFWGGAGSLVDVWLSSENHHVSDDFSRDNRLLREMLLNLLLALKNIGYSWPRMDFQESFLQKNLAV